MTFEFGELNFESCGALADDEDEDMDSKIGLEFEWTQTGEKEYQSKKGSHLFCAFVGKIALGFGEGFVSGQKDGSNFTQIAQVFLNGSEGTVDLCSLKRSKKIVARIFLGGGTQPAVFALINFYGVPRILSNELTEKISELINVSSKVVIFHSDISAYYLAPAGEEKNCEGKLYFLGSSICDWKSISNSVKPLPGPNVVSGPSASILSHCEMLDKEALMLITYSETELVDSISMYPFFQAVNLKSVQSSLQLFSQLQHYINQSLKVNGSSVVDSNLYL